VRIIFFAVNALLPAKLKKASGALSVADKVSDGAGFAFNSVQGQKRDSRKSTRTAKKESGRRRARAHPALHVHDRTGRPPQSLHKAAG
jgi:hypothetical protein